MSSDTARKTESNIVGAKSDDQHRNSLPRKAVEFHSHLNPRPSARNGTYIHDIVLRRVLTFLLNLIFVCYYDYIANKEIFSEFLFHKNISL